MSAVAGGALVGGLQSALFNPWDRALYLSVKEKRPFLHRDNWRHPWQGWMQTSVQRVVSGGLYFVLQGVTTDALDLGSVPAAWRAFTVGLVAGALNGALLNPIAAVKYHQWGSARTWRGSVAHAWRQGGVHPFFKGITATVSRDAVFGTAYEVGRHRLLHLMPAALHDDARAHFAANMLGAAVATMLSSPFNYVRSMQYATPPEQTPRRAGEQLMRLWRNVRAQGPLRAQLGYMQQRLRVGWGTARVAVGMALAQYVFSRFRDD